MKTKNFIKIAIWLFITMYAVTKGLDMLSTTNTVENIVGFIILMAVLVITLETKCLTNIKFKKDEKNN